MMTAMSVTCKDDMQDRHAPLFYCVFGDKTNPVSAQHRHTGVASTSASGTVHEQLTRARGDQHQILTTTY